MVAAAAEDKQQDTPSELSNLCMLGPQAAAAAIVAVDATPSVAARTAVVAPPWGSCRAGIETSAYDHLTHAATAAAAGYGKLQQCEQQHPDAAKF